MSDSQTVRLASTHRCTPMRDDSHTASVVSTQPSPTPDATHTVACVSCDQHGHSPSQTGRSSWGHRPSWHHHHSQTPQSSVWCVAGWLRTVAQSPRNTRSAPPPQIPPRRTGCVDDHSGPSNASSRYFPIHSSRPTLHHPPTRTVCCHQSCQCQCRCRCWC